MECEDMSKQDDRERRQNLLRYLDIRIKESALNRDMRAVINYKNAFYLVIRQYLPVVARS